MIHIYASKPHYQRHVDAVWKALGPDVGVAAPRPNGIPNDGLPVLVASAVDMQAMSTHPIIYMEHGSGQGYEGLQHVSWPGGVGRESIKLYLAPRQSVLDVHLARYPGTAGGVIGCPALDRHVVAPRPRNDRPVVAFTAHWYAPAAARIPELRSAFPHYEKALPGIVGELRDAGCEVVGHFHPRFRSLGRWWKAQGVAVEPDWDALLARLDVLVADNTSALPEAAALGRGTVWLGCSEWRRDVIHGGRFYEWPRFGTEVWEPSEVVAAVLREVSRTHDGAEAMRAVYTFDDGRCAERAAEAIRAWIRDP